MLEIEMRPVADLVPYARNARTHPDEQIAQIAASIREFGWTNPVLIEPDGGIIAGHGRVMAARKLNMAEVPCIALADLSDAKKRALVIADNKIPANAGWDVDLLDCEFAELEEADFDIAVLGFSTDEMATIQADQNFAPATEAEQTPLDRKKPVTCPACDHEFRV